MADFGIILGLKYAKKKRLVFLFLSEKFHLMAIISGQTFGNYNASIGCSIQSHKFKVVFTTYRSFSTNLQTRYKLTNRNLKTSPH